jgi:D-alanyl-lipoteichoic acid acyltransferase DltB (MBOAT superfamily)
LRFDPDSAERRLRRNSWLLVLISSLLALFWGPLTAAAVAASGALAALNVEGLSRLVGLVVSRSPRSASLLTVVGVGFRYLLLGVGLFVIVGVWRANVFAVTLGLSAPVLAVFLEWGFDSMREFRSR